MDVRRTNIFIKPNISRVLVRPFELPRGERPLRVIGRVMALPEDEVERLLAGVIEEFHGRHYRIREFFLHRFEQMREFLLTDQPLSDARKQLIGSYFTQEYSLESAALFNPSLVWHPDQSGLAEGSRRFVMSLRATGEGHLSSITFRTGTIDAALGIHIDAPTRYVTQPDTVPNARYEKALFHRKLYELGLANGLAEKLFAILDDSFTLLELERAIEQVQRSSRTQQREQEPIAQAIRALARSNYEIQYSPELSLSERIIFPSAPTEANGIEDARFVRFQEDDGTVRYYATYTAYDGKVIFPQLLETDDFLRFRMNTLNGPEVRNKGLALFPRKIGGHYCMLSRQDGENVFVMFSDMPHFWYHKEIVAKPTFPWEFVQLGNCGSPIETDAGWLVLTHGVGPMRKYSIGAFLLDRDDPRRLVGRLRRPLLMPNAAEREGYVPNVVYSCGGLVHQGTLVIPYAMSDYASSFALVGMDELLAEMERM